MDSISPKSLVKKSKKTEDDKYEIYDFLAEAEEENDPYAGCTTHCLFSTN